MNKNLNLEIGNKLHGFSVDRCVRLEELSANLYEMTHEGTELKLVYIDREEENKTFAITFETLPWNDTGVFHILEHSVLCGSDRYPVKEPFVELLKNSMNTFLNAMTFPDKTMYPVSSKNNQDFINLMRVYLDAVLNPAIYNKPEIFMQEGWHYEKDDNGNVSYKGVVFNEMKGAMADAGEIMESALNRAMLPDTPYSYNSGGDPAKIPDLSYDDFIRAHRKFYSPTNGTIFLDGTMDIEQILAIIDDEFLKGLAKGERIAPPAMQRPVDGGSQRVKFEIGADQPIEERMRMAWGRGLGRFDEREKIVAMDILADVLAGSNEAYLSKLILEKGLAEDVIVRAYSGIGHPWVKLEVRNFNEKDADEIEQVVFSEIQRLVSEGIDHERLEAVMANQEFAMEERDFGTYPQGLFLGFMVMDSLLYGGAPELFLEKGDLFVNLRRMMKEGYFEKLLEEVILDNTHKCKVILEPSTTLGEERRAEEDNRIKQAMGAWSPAQQDKIVKEQEKLQDWQDSEDTPEDLSRLPHLTLDDIDIEPEHVPTVAREVDGAQLVYHPIQTGDIRYITMYFDVNGYDKKMLSEISFLAELVGTLHTSSLESEALMVAEQKLLGRLDYDLVSYQKNNTSEMGRLMFVVTFSVLKDNVDEAIELMTGVLKETKFDQDSRILDILKQCRQERMQSYIMGGNSAAMRRVMAMTNSSAAAQEAITGYEYYKWLCDKADNWNPEEMKLSMEKALAKVVNANNLTVSVTAPEGSDPDGLVRKIANSLPRFVDEGERSTIEPKGISRDAIVIPADISFAVRGGDIMAAGNGYDGNLQVATRVASLAFLWNEIRVKGGAYGAGMTIHPSGNLFCYSFRDPSGAASLDKYMECGNFLREMASSDFDLDGFIIGAISDASPVTTPRIRAQMGDSFYFRGISDDYRRQVRKEILETTKEDLKRLADKIDEALKSGGFCVVGGEEQVKALGELDNVLTI